MFLAAIVSITRLDRAMSEGSEECMYAGTCTCPISFTDDVLLQEESVGRQPSKFAFSSYVVYMLLLAQTSDPSD